MLCGNFVGNSYLLYLKEKLEYSIFFRFVNLTMSFKNNLRVFFVGVNPSLNKNDNEEIFRAAKNQFYRLIVASGKYINRGEKDTENTYL